MHYIFLKGVSFLIIVQPLKIGIIGASDSEESQSECPVHNPIIQKCQNPIHIKLMNNEYAGKVQQLTVNKICHGIFFTSPVRGQ